MENRQFGEGARDVCDVVCSVLSLFFAYMDLGRVFLILWREILQCSPYLPHLRVHSQGLYHLGFEEESQNIELLPLQQINGLHCYTLPIA
jgi:hypothetical protein